MILCTQLVASAPVRKRQRSARITRRSQRSRKSRSVSQAQLQVPPAPAAAVRSTPSAVTATSSSSTLRTSAPATAANSSSVAAPPPTLPPLIVTFDPVQVALDTFDKVVNSSQSNNMTITVSAHIYRALFQQFVTSCSIQYPQPLTPTDLINITVSTLKALGLA